MHVTVVLLGHTAPGLPQLMGSIAKSFNSGVSYQFVDFPFTRSFRSSRKQYDAEMLVKEFSHMVPMPPERVLLITREDIFAQGMDSVFGYSFGRCAIISLARLDPRYYGEVPVMADGGALIKERMGKEAIHEIGHTMGLGHCGDPKCVMALSETIERVDSKGSAFCEKCSKALTTS